MDTHTATQPPAAGQAADHATALTMGDPCHHFAEGGDYWTVNLFTASGQKHFAEVSGYSRLEAEFNARLIRNALASYRF